MTCRITDRDQKITTKKVDGKPVRLVVQKATRKCSDDVRALGEQETLEDQEQEQDLGFEGLSPEELTEFNSTWIHAHLAAHTKAISRNFTRPRSFDVPNS